MAGVTAKYEISGNGAGGLTGGSSNFLEIQATLYHAGIGRMFPEKIVKICSVVAKLLLLICLRAKSSPPTIEKIALPAYPIILCENMYVCMYVCMYTALITHQYVMQKGRKKLHLHES